MRSTSYPTGMKSSHILAGGEGGSLLKANKSFVIISVTTYSVCKANATMTIGCRTQMLRRVEDTGLWSARTQVTSFNVTSQHPIDGARFSLQVRRRLSLTHLTETHHPPPTQ